MEESAGSVLSLNMAAREEIKILPHDEYELQISKVMPMDCEADGEGKIGKKSRLSVICEVIGEPTADDIFHTIFYPNSEDSPKQRNKKMDQIARFMTAIGLDPDVAELNLSDWVGCKFMAILDEDEYEGTPKNVIKKVVPPGR